MFSIEEADKLYSIIDKKINYLVDSLKSYILKSGYNYLLNVNIGLSIYPLHSENAEDLISKAHHAMTLVDINKYDYKIYNKESFINKLDRESIKKDLEKAMKRKELFLNFQPKVRTDNKNIVSVEALIRWKHPQKGDISPGKFIPMAEKSGFIKKIGVWVLNESYKKIENWIKLGYEKISISVNISSIELNDPKILKQIENISKKYSLPNNLIEFEITERTFTEVPENVLNRLKELGFLISLDDFGTGYSSLSYFKKFPIDKLKIDKIFIDSIDEWKTKTLVETVVDVSHKFGLEVVAEGVENKQQLDILKKLKCDYIQGYYFYKPMSDKELEDLLVE